MDNRPWKIKVRIDEGVDELTFDTFEECVYALGKQAARLMETLEVTILPTRFPMKGEWYNTT